MIINSDYLKDNKDKINENITAIEMVSNAYTILEEDEIESLRESMLVDSMDKFIAFSHIHDRIELNEDMVNYVNSRGERGIRKSRETRSTMAFKTTSISKFKRRETALKASKTRMSSPSNVKKANRKRNKARRKRTSLGLNGE